MVFPIIGPKAFTMRHPNAERWLNHNEYLNRSFT